MGQETVYCFKCQKRIHGTDYAKGLAYQVENNFCCSGCAVHVLETLPPKAKEQLLAKMFKATQERQSTSSGALKTQGGGAPSAHSTARIPVAPTRPAAPPSSTVPMMVGVAVALAAVVLAVIFLTSSSSPPPPPPAPVAQPKPRIVEPPPPAGPTPEERRAKEAVQKARDFATVNPRNFEGQAEQWRAALRDAERTGYEQEVRRELDRSETRARDLLEQEFADLGREARAVLARKDFKGAVELVEKARTKHSGGWPARVDGLLRELETARENSWHPIFDGRTTSCLGTYSAAYWRVEDGALLRNPAKDQAAQSREDFTDGEFRFRFSVQGASQFYIAVRQGDSQVRFMATRAAMDALEGKIHELIITCKGNSITATLDGVATPLMTLGKVLPKGRLQFNHVEGVFRIHSIDIRDVP